MKQLSLFIFTTTLVAAISCNKSTLPTDPEPTPTPSSEKTIEFILPVTSEQKAFFEQQFEFDLNGTKVTFKESDMTKMTTEADIARIPKIVLNTNKALTFLYGTGHTETAQFYKYTLGKLKKGETVSAVSRIPVIKSDRSSVEDFNCILGYDLLIDGKEDVLFYVSYHKGVFNTDDAITSLFNLTKKDFLKLTYSYK